MIDRSLLFEAKAFLCWEKFDQLSIKLIPIKDPVAFFYPPTKEIATIHLFYRDDTADFSPSICLLFHEAGHFQQWQRLSGSGKEDEFWYGLNLDKGNEKISFEAEAWELGRQLLHEFVDRMDKNCGELINIYGALAQQSLLTYAE